MPFRENVKAPVGVAPPVLGAFALTVAVKVTGVPVLVGFDRFEMMVVVVLALLTTCGLPVRLPELGSNPALPEYEADTV